MRARDLGIVLGRLGPGPLNAITDVAGVRVGHATLIRGDGPLVVGQGPVRTGVTVIVPHDGDPFIEPVFAGCHRLNGNGELTGLEWIRESGLPDEPDRDHQHPLVGVVHDALIAHAVRRTAARRTSGRCRSSARRTTACSTTSTASTSARSTSTRRSAAAAAARSPRATSAAGPG